MVTKFINDADDLPFFNIRANGAVQDGTTNDSAAVQTTLEEAKAAGGGRIYFPRGTTKISTPCAVDMGDKRGMYILEGEGSGSRLLTTGLGSNVAISIATANYVKFSKLAFVGSTTGGLSDGNYDTNGSIVYTSFCEKTAFEDVIFAGLATQGSDFAWSGIVSNYNGGLSLKNVIFGASMSRDTGVVQVYQSYGIDTDNVLFIDYIDLNDIEYNKLSNIGNTNSWIRSVAPLTLVAAPIRPLLLNLKNTEFDENTGDALIVATGNSDYSVRLENVSMNGGFGLKPSFKFNTFRKVTFRDVFNGLSSNTTDFESGQFTDVGLVDIDNLLHKYGAKYISLLGTTGKLVIRNSRLQGNGTHTTGVNNAAGATVDASPALPNQL